MDKALSQIDVQYTITVTLVSNPVTLNNLALINLIESKIKNIVRSHPLIMSTPFHSVNFSDNQLFDKLIDRESEAKSVELILIYNVLEANCSDFIGYFLLNSRKDKAIKYKGYLLRQLVTDDLKKAITQLIEMQPIVTQSQHIWLANPEVSDAFVLLLQKLSVMAEFAEHDIPLPEQKQLDLYLGISSSLSHWLAIHFACNTAESEQSAQLVMGKQIDKTIFNVIVPVNFMEDSTTL